MLKCFLKGYQYVQANDIFPGDNDRGVQAYTDKEQVIRSSGVCSYEGIDFSECLVKELTEIFGLALDFAEKEGEFAGIFETYHPQLLFVDEDVAPYAKNMVRVARKYGVASFVSQHGIPCYSIGFRPLTADHMISFGKTSTEQFIKWDIPKDRILEIGCFEKNRVAIVPQYKRGGDKKTITVFMNVPLPPYGFRYMHAPLSRTRMANVIENLISWAKEQKDVRLVIKMHPNGKDVLPYGLSPGKHGNILIVKKRNARELIKKSDLVLSGWSTAFFESLLLGVPALVFFSKDKVFDIGGDFLVDLEEDKEKAFFRIKELLWDGSARSCYTLKIKDEMARHVADNNSNVIDRVVNMAIEK